MSSTKNIGRGTTRQPPWSRSAHAYATAALVMTACASEPELLQFQDAPLLAVGAAAEKRMFEQPFPDTNAGRKAEHASPVFEHKSSRSQQAFEGACHTR